MPRPARRTRSPGNAPPERLEEPKSEIALDPADIILGVVLFLAIPSVIYIMMSAAGKPVSGRGGVTWTESLQREETIAARKPPPMNSQEFQMRLAHIDRLLDQNVAEFIKRFRAGDKAVEQERWWRVALAALNHCDDLLKKLEKSIRESEELSRSNANIQEVSGRKSKITQDIADLNKDRPFLLNH